MTLSAVRFISVYFTLVAAAVLFSNPANASSATANLGQSVTFSVSAQGTAPFSYQWRKNGASIPGATNASYTIAAITTSDAASYSAQVSNTAGSTLSDDAVLSVATPPPSVVAPSITAQPASLTVTEGQAASFTVTASGTSLSYQWRKNGTAIPNAITATFSLASASAADAASYTVVVSNSAGSVTSNAASLTIDAAATPPKLMPLTFSARGDYAPVEGITQLFDGQTNTKWLDHSPSSWIKISLASPAVLEAYSLTSANDCIERDPISWTLYGSNDNVLWSVIESRSAQSWNARFLNRNFILSAPSAAYRWFRFEVQATSGQITQLAELKLFGTSTNTPPLPDSTLSITAQPASITVTAGQAATFSVSASGYMLSYQWCKNGTAIPGASGATYSLASISAADAASYTVVVSNAAGSVTSNAATLTVNNACGLVKLTPQTFSARGDFAPVEGIPQLFDGMPNTKWLDFSASSWIKICLASPAVLEAYSLTSANDYAERDPASWTLSGSNDDVLWTVIESRSAQSWASRFLCRDFYLNTPPAAYRWFRFDFQSSSGQITQLAELEIFGTHTNTAPVTPTAPAITTQPAGQSVFVSLPATFSVAATGSTLSYQWRKNGTAIAGANDPTYTITASSPSDAANYSVVVSNALGTATSTPAPLTVNTLSALVKFTPQSFSARGDFAPVEGIKQLFDGQINTKWLDFSAFSWIKICLPAPKVLDAYTITSANDFVERDPASWTLSGSNDDILWTVIESRSEQSWNNRFLSRDFVLSAPSAAYRWFRFDFQATSGQITQLAELELFGQP